MEGPVDRVVLLSIALYLMMTMKNVNWARSEASCDSDVVESLTVYLFALAGG